MTDKNNVTGPDTDLATLRQMTRLVRDAVGFALAEKNIPREPTWTLLVPQHLDDIDASADRVEAELSRLRAVVDDAVGAIEAADRLRDQRDAALRIAPAVRQVIEKALRRDMTQPPVTREELQLALDLLPEPPSFRSSVDGMAALDAAEARCARLQQALREIADAVYLYDESLHPEKEPDDLLLDIGVKARSSLTESDAGLPDTPATKTRTPAQRDTRYLLTQPDTPTVIDGDELIAAVSDPQVQKLLADAREYGAGITSAEAERDAKLVIHEGDLNDLRGGVS